MNRLVFNAIPPEMMEYFNSRPGAGNICPVFASVNAKSEANPESQSRQLDQVVRALSVSEAKCAACVGVPGRGEGETCFAPGPTS
jgi:hypothetical protein